MESVAEIIDQSCPGQFASVRLDQISLSFDGGHQAVRAEPTIGRLHPSWIYEQVARNRLWRRERFPFPVRAASDLQPDPPYDLVFDIAALINRRDHDHNEFGFSQPPAKCDSHDN